MNLYRRDNGRWYARFTTNGKRRMLSTGETDKTKALLKLGELLKNSESTDTPETLDDLAGKYMSYAETNKADSTVLRDKRRLQGLLHAFGSFELADITQRKVEYYLQRRRKEVSPATVNRDLALLKHMLNKAVDWGLIQENPIRRVKQLKEPPGRIRYLTDDERERLLKACQQSESEILFPVVLTALLTGMRKSELQRLRWKDISFPQARITVKRSKNNGVRHIPVHNDLIPVLEDLHQRFPDNEYVFSKPDGRPYGDWKKAFESARRRANLEDFKFHDCRHDFCSQLGMNGCNVYTIMQLAGHKDIKMSARYTHISDTQMKAAIDQIGANLVQK